MSETILTTPTARRHLGGAPLLPPVLSYAVLTVLAAFLPSLVAGVRPWASDRDLLRFFAQHDGAAHLSAFLTLGAAVPLVVSSAVVSARLRRLGLDVPGRVIALAGGTVAGAMLALAGVATLAATQDRVGDSPAAIRTLHAVTFAAGGPAFVLFTGLLVAGVAIPALIGRVLPRPLAWAGLAIAVVCELAGALSTLTDSADAGLPIGRFGSLLWLIAVAVLLPVRRPRRDA